jgi:hypothetical protein
MNIITTKTAAVKGIFILRLRLAAGKEACRRHPFVKRDGTRGRAFPLLLIQQTRNTAGFPPFHHCSFAERIIRSKEYHPAVPHLLNE